MCLVGKELGSLPIPEYDDESVRVLLKEGPYAFSRRYRVVFYLYQGNQTLGQLPLNRSGSVWLSSRDRQCMRELSSHHLNPSPRNRQ